MQHTIDTRGAEIANWNTRHNDFLSTITKLRLLINTYNGFTRAEFESYMVNDLRVINYYDNGDFTPDEVWDRFQSMCDEEELPRDINRV
eukprot:1244147-Heterocapsa_arctica.AAC.1